MHHVLELATSYGPAVLAWLCVLSTAASAIVALTPTPPAESGLRTPYTVIEKLGLVAGYAKDQGYITPTARQAALANGLVQIGARLVSRTTVGDVPAIPAPVVVNPPVSAADLATVMAGVAEMAAAVRQLADTRQMVLAGAAHGAAASGAAETSSGSVPIGAPAVPA